MAEMRTEEEQVEALKDWWKENGKALLLGVALALAIVFGWKGWQNNQQVTAENAAIVYQNLAQAVVIASAPGATEDQQVTAQHLASTLKQDYADSAYARFGAMLAARMSVESGDFNAAISEFDWVLGQEPDAVMTTVVTMRKARVLAAKGDLQQAVTLLESLSGGTFKVSVEELKGDLYLQMNDTAKARAAYQVAIEFIAQQGSRPILNMKFDNLSVEGN